MVIFAMLLFVLFLVLDLTEQISWDPIWITSPLWGVLILGLCISIETAIRKEGKKEDG